MAIYSHGGALALAFASGALASFGFAPHSLPAALLLGLVLWLLSLRTCSVGQALSRGLFFGLGYFGFGLYWLYYTAHVYGHIPMVLAVVFTSILVLYLSLYPALAAALGARFFSVRSPRLIATALLFGLLEWVRGLVFGGFPWVLVGQGTLDGPYSGYLPLVGVYGAGLLLLLTAALLAASLRPHLAIGAEQVILAGLLLLAGNSLREISWTEAEGGAQDIALVQAGIEQESRWQPGFLSLTWERYRELTAQAGDVSLVIWPEAAVPVLFHSAKDLYKEVSEQVLAEDATLVTGTFHTDSETGELTNTLLNLESGQQYHKRRLVPFGEQMPGKKWLGFLYENFQVPMQEMSPGKEPPLILIKGEKVLVSICYETIFSDLVSASDSSVGWLLNISNDGWFGDTRGPWQHFEAARLRALELGREMVRVAVTGVSAVIGSDGEVREALPQFSAGVLTSSVQPYRGETPYMRWREWPFFLVLAAVLLLCWRQAMKRRINDRFFRM